jgi:16S rRNA U516 pseudouridylate synthase RsuA-like enzyme
MTLADEFRQMVAALEARERAAEQREKELAKAAEDLTQTEAVQVALRCGKQEAIGRVVALIDLQLETLGRAGLNAISLRTLRKHIVDDLSHE